MSNKTATTISVAISFLSFSTLLLRYPEQKNAILFIGTIPILSLSFALAYLSVTAIAKMKLLCYWKNIREYILRDLRKDLALFFNLTKTTPSFEPPPQYLLFELPEYCRADGNKLIIKRKSAADFWIMIFVWLFMTACFVVLFKIIGLLHIALFVTPFFIGTYFFMKPHYFPSVTEIDFCAKYVRLKGPSFSRWRTFSIKNTQELLSTTMKVFKRTKYLQLNMQLEGNTYCLKEFGVGIIADNLEPLSLKMFIEQGLADGIAPGDLLKINLGNPTVALDQAAYRKRIRNKRLLYAGQLLTIVGIFCALLFFL